MENHTNCIFCNLLEESGNYSFVADMQAGRLLVNYSQTYEGRCMYIYNKHAKDITEIDMIDNSIVALEIVLISRVLKSVFNPELINIASLGNEVPHLHWHLIPRYENDPNRGKPPWPHEKQVVTPEQCIELSKRIYTALLGFDSQEYKVEILDNKSKILRFVKK